MNERKKKGQSCLSGFVYHYSNHFTAPRRVILIDIPAFPPIPDLINPEPSGSELPLKALLTTESTL